jgi:hypothetical protein
MDAGAEWDLIDSATTAIGLQLGSNAASEAIRYYLWRAKDPKGRRMDPTPDFIVTGIPDAAELERLTIGVANASTASPEEQAAVVGIIRRAFRK